MKYALERNKQRTHTHANVKFMDAWRQAVGVLFIVVPLEILPCPRRLQIILDTLHLLINKVCHVTPHVPFIYPVKQLRYLFNFPNSFFVVIC